MKGFVERNLFCGLVRELSSNKVTSIISCYWFNLIMGEKSMSTRWRGLKRLFEWLFKGHLLYFKCEGKG